MFFRQFCKLSAFALCASSVLLYKKKLSNKKMSTPNFRILIAGGSLFAKESGIHATCELLTVSSDGIVRSSPFASLTIPRRGANCISTPKDENSRRIWIIGGCTAEAEDSRIRHANSGEFFDYDFRDSTISKTGSWHLFPRLLNVGRSCFSTTTFISENRNDDFVFILGGWNGVECLSSVECVRLTVGQNEMTNNCSQLPQIQHAATTGGAATQRATTPVITPATTPTTPTTGDVDVDNDDDDDEEECVSTADLISPIKNGCTLVVGDVVRPDRLSLLLIGGWDGKRTLNTIFRYTFAADQDARSWKTIFESNKAQLDRLLPYSVECHASLLHENRAIYIIGGFDGVRVLDSIVRIDLENGSIDVLPTKLAVPRECHCAELLVGDQSETLLSVMGGWDGYKALRSVELFRVIDQEPYLVPISVTDNALIHPRNRACSIVLPS